MTLPSADNAVAGAVSRRGLLGAGTATVVAPLLGAGAGRPATAGAPSVVPRGRRPDRHNLLFVFTDQERHMSIWPAGFTLPGRARLQRSGTAFGKHYTSATVCASSRTVLMTGLQTPDNGMLDEIGDAVPNPTATRRGPSRAFPCAGTTRRRHSPSASAKAHSRDCSPHGRSRWW